MKATLLLAVSSLALAGCASVGKGAADKEHAAHRPGEVVVPAPQPARVDQQMKVMQDMHQRMIAAKTPEERHALMAEHMKAMQEGMSMMCEMGQGGMGSPGAAGTQDMMKRCMDMKDMTLKMMTDREAPKVPAK